MVSKASVESDFEEFFSANPDCVVVDTSVKLRDELGSFQIANPWGDKTLSIFLPDDDTERLALAKHLNGVVLPPRYSAVLHRSTQHLEVLWTAYRLRAASTEIKDREFTLNWEGVDRVLRFGDSSDAVLSLAKRCFATSNESLTNHRNILSFNLFAENPDHPALDRPLSFFVDCSGIDVEDLNEFVLHVNAYMTYFDRKSPRILIHSDAENDLTPRDRYVEGEFPKKISARRIDANLLSFWNEVFMSNDQIMRFLLCYRIVEYAAFNYLGAKTKQEIRRLLSKPSLPQSVDEAIDKLVEALVQSKEIEAIPRTQNLVAETVDLEKLWENIELNLDYFRGEHVFDGGFRVAPLLSGKCDFQTWKTNGVRNTMDRLRGIRNALSHGQDGSTRGTIRPTKVNEHSLLPWVNLIEIIAGDAMLLHRT